MSSPVFDVHGKVAIVTEASRGLELVPSGGRRSRVIRMPAMHGDHSTSSLER
jgi:hypothetical protein